MTKIKSYLGNQCLTSIDYSLVYPYLIYGCYCGEIIMIIHYHSSYVYKIKQVRIMNDVPLRDHITPHYVHLDLLNFVILLKFTIVCFYMILSLIISRVIFHYFLYLSNIIILHEVHLLSNYTFPTQELIFESFALPSLENTIGTISPFLFSINHRKSCSKRHLKNIILLNIDGCACVCACARVCVLMNNKTTKE